MVFRQTKILPTVWCSGLLEILPAKPGRSAVHFEGPADHVAVRYGLDFELNFRGHAPLVVDRSSEDFRKATFLFVWTDAFA